AVADLEGPPGPAAPEAEGEAPPRRSGGLAEQEAAREAVQLGGAPVVLAHEDLRGEQAAARAIAELLGQRRLQVEGEEVRLPAGREVGLVADPPRVVVGAQRRAVLAVADAAAAEEGGQPADAEPRVGDPQHGVEVAQAAGALLDVGLLQADLRPEPCIALA